VTAVSVPAGLRRAPVAIPRRIIALGTAATAVVLYVALAGTATQPHDQNQPLFLALNETRDWVRDNRNNAVFTLLFAGPRAAIDALVVNLTEVFRLVGWTGIAAVAGVLGYVSGGWRLAALGAVGFLAIGALGLWDSGVDTLGAVFAAVAIALAIGIPLGILTAQRPRVQRVLSPILDVMQITPTFSYLAPLVLIFGIGGAAATIVTLIYALPATIRITALGIREVPRTSVEAADSLGATGWQRLRKVRLPLAGRAIGLAVNQTLMLALSMIVLTALIDAPGLGQEIIQSLTRNNVGRMLQAGIAIVILAIVLDRLSEQASRRLDPRAISSARRLSRRTLAIAGAIALAGVVLGVLVPGAREFPSAINVSVRQPVNDFVDFLRSDVAWLTTGLKDAITIGFLNPLQTVLEESPWWLVVGVTAVLAWLISGRRQAVVAALGLGLIFAIGLWEHTMQTLLQVLVATAVTFALGLGLGILSARHDRFARAIRPLLDAAQVLPSFVYLLPVLVLFGPGKLTAIVAAIVFALPVVIRLVEIGIRLVPATIVEAATSAGASRRQLLLKAQLPVARAALLLAANQATILVLSVVVIGGLVGGQALGYDVVAGFSQTRLFGMGVAAGVVLVLLGIVLDQVTQGAGGRTGPEVLRR
jgi:glycine betaine/proline transport system permease protein